MFSNLKRFDKIENIPLFLEEREKELGVKLDFSLIGTQTGYVKNDGDSLKIINDLSFFNKNSYFTADITIKQLHTIETYEYSKELQPPFHFELEEKADTKLQAILICRNSLKFSSDLKTEIYQALYKTMVLNGYLIKIREYKNLSLEIDDLVKGVISFNYPKKTRFDVAVGVGLSSKTQESVTYHFNKNDFVSSSISGDFEQKQFLFPFKTGDLLFEYVKPNSPTRGRDLKGNFLEANSSSVSCPIKVKEGILSQNNPTTIKFVAAHDGFLKEIAPNVYAITNELNTGEVQNQDGNDKRVIKISGATDFKSNIKGDTLFISVCRGKIEANVAVVDVLEKGIIHAKVVFVKTSLGGVIKADYVYIGTIRSRNRIYSRYSIVIDKIIGEHNLLEINPDKFVFLKKSRVYHLRLSYELKVRLRHLNKKMDEIYHYLFNSQSYIAQIRNKESQRLATAKNLEDLQRHERFLRTYKQSLAEYRDLVSLWHVNKAMLKDISEAAFHAKIIITQGCEKQGTLIRFRAYNYAQENSKDMLLPQCTTKTCRAVNKEKMAITLNDEVYPQDIAWIKKLKPKP